MTNDHELRVQQMLHDTFPIYRFMDLRVVRLGNVTECLLPFIPENCNHFGAMHAGALFSLAEVVAGIAITHRSEFSERPLAALDIGIRYLKVAKTPIIGRVELSDETLGSLASNIRTDTRHRFQIHTVLSDSAGDAVAEATCLFQFLSRPFAA